MRPHGFGLRDRAGDGAVEASLQLAIAFAQQQGAKLWEIGTATLLARILAERGRCGGARAMLAPRYCTLTEAFEMPALKKAAAVLALLT